MTIDELLEGSLTQREEYHGTGKEVTERGQPRVTIDMLPDVALLDVFEFYLYGKRCTIWTRKSIFSEPWLTLVHVCQKWRNIVFGSSRRLELLLYCKAETSGMLDIWPPLPIVMRAVSPQEQYVDNIVTVLKHNDRIYDLELEFLSSSQWEKIWPAMQQPFPALTYLKFQFLYEKESMLVNPDSFLGGSAPGLRSLRLSHVSFPGLPKLLLSITHLVHLKLTKIPNSGHISPESLVTSLSKLTRLERLIFRFKYFQSRLDKRNQHPPLQTRTILPVLTFFEFEGDSEYLENFIARIDAPLLKDLSVVFLPLPSQDPPYRIDTPQVTQFISRTPMLEARNGGSVSFDTWMS